MVIPVPEFIELGVSKHTGVGVEEFERDGVQQVLIIEFLFEIFGYFADHIFEDRDAVPGQDFIPEVEVPDDLGDEHFEKLLEALDVGAG